MTGATEDMKAGGHERQRRDDKQTASAHLSDEQIADLKEKYPQLQIQKKQRATPKQRVIIWLTGSVIAALLPLAAIAVSAAADKEPYGFYEITAKGDLLVISAVLMIAGLAELVLLFWRMPDGKELHVALMPLGIVLYLAGDAFWYGIVSSRLPISSDPTGSPVLAYGSTAIFIIAAVVSSYCVWLAGTGE